MAIRVQIRRDTASKWQSANPILLAGELGIEQDTSKWKIGNGIDPWTTRPYVTQGIKGDPGRAFVYDDFTQPQLDALKQGIMTMAQGELSTLIDNTTLTVNDLVSDVNTVVTTANQTNQAMLTAEQLRESQEADRLVAENTRATFYTGYRDSLDLLQGSKANVADVYKKTETYKKNEVDASLSALTTDVNAQLAEHKLDYVEYLESELGEEHIIRSLPNGTKDEVSITDSKLIKRVSDEVVLQSTDINSIFNLTNNTIFYTKAFIDMKPSAGSITGTIDVYDKSETIADFRDNIESQGKYYTTSDNRRIYFVFPLGTALAEAELTNQKLTYQLATPIEIPLPNPMTPNTREIVRQAIEQEKLRNAIIALGGTIV